MNEGLSPIVKSPFYGVRIAIGVAEAEVEYEERVSKAVDVSFLAADKNTVEKIEKIFNAPATKEKWVAAVIWTTTAWTLPANRAIVVHPELEYVFIGDG